MPFQPINHYPSAHPVTLDTIVVADFDHDDFANLSLRTPVPKDTAPAIARRALKPKRQAASKRQRQQPRYWLRSDRSGTTSENPLIIPEDIAEPSSNPSIKGTDAPAAPISAVEEKHCARNKRIAEPSSNSSIQGTDAPAAPLTAEEKRRARNKRISECIKALYARRKANGECRVCCKPVTPGRVTCLECRTREAEKKRESRADARAQNLCSECHRPPRPGQRLCARCAERNRERARQSRARKMCGRCLKVPREVGKICCKECNMKVQERKAADKLRGEAENAASELGPSGSEYEPSSSEYESSTGEYEPSTSEHESNTSEYGPSTSERESSNTEGDTVSRLDEFPDICAREAPGSSARPQRIAISDLLN